MTAVNEATGEVKDFATNAVGESLERVLWVVFRSATIEHTFRLAKHKVGLMHYECRQNLGLVRHFVMLGFVAEQSIGFGGKTPR